MKIKHILWLCCLLLPLSMAAQKVTLTGVVRDKQGESLPMAYVQELDGKSKVMTDIDGRYSIQTEVGKTIEFTYVGFSPYHYKVKAGDRVVDITMQEDSKELEAVVVTALGIKRQEKALSYNTSTVKPEELTRVKDANLMNSLSGKVAGVNIQSSSSGAGGATRVVMRGVKSIEGNNNALYVIDGVPMFNSVAKEGAGQYASRGSTEGIADLNSDDIESITVLTGASAAALYGSSAANGAILITTKRGSTGVPKVSFSSMAEFGRPFVVPHFQDTYGSAKDAATSWGKKQSASGYNPKDDFYKTAMTFTNALNVSMGSEKNQTYLSAAYTDARGLVPNNRYDRLNLTLRNTTTTLGDKLKVDLGVQYILQRDQNMVNQGEYMNPIVPAYLFPRGMNWDDVYNHFEAWDENRGLLTSSFFPEGDYTMQNPKWVAYRNLRTQKRHRYMISLGATYELMRWSPSEVWNVGARYRLDNTRGIYQDKRYVGTLPTLMAGGDRNGFYAYDRTLDEQYYADILTNFNKNLSEDLSLAVNLGASINDMKQDNLFNRGPLRNDGLPNVFNVQNIAQEAGKSSFIQEGWHEQTQSVFGSMELGYKRMLYLTLTGRNDWASQLAGSNHSSFFYPSVGLSGVLTEMMPTLWREKSRHILGYAKLRAAFAAVASPFQHGLTMPRNVFDENSKQWVKEGFYPLIDLKPERTNSFEVGLSTKWLRNFLSLDVTYYHTDTRNQTIRAEMSAGSGYNYTYVQTGSVVNQGVELTLSTNWDITKDINWTSTYTLGYNKNRINELVKDVRNPQNPSEPLFERDELVKGGMGNSRIILRPGGTLGDVYALTDFVRNPYGTIDLSQDLKQRKDYLYLGSLLPKANMSWKNDFSIKNVNFGFLLSARLGGIAISGTEAALDFSGVSERSAEARDRGGVELAPGILAPAEGYYQMRGRPKDYLTQYYTYSATNVRLREVYLGMSFSPKVFGHKVGLNLSVVAKNLLMIYSKAPFDPENISSTANYAQGLDYFTLPSQRTIGINAKVNF